MARNWSLLAGALLLITVGQVRSEKPVEPPIDIEGASQFQSARDLFNAGAYLMAIDELDAFRKQFPHSRSTPEAMYKLACAHLLRDQASDATACFLDLIAQHLESPYAQLAIRGQVANEDLLKLADKQRQQARASKAPANWRRAATLYHHYLERLPAKEAALKKEAFYKKADCMFAIDRAAFRQQMESLVEGDPEGDWGRLAQYRLMTSEEFALHIEELAGTAGAAYQEAYLDMADVYQYLLQGTDRLACDYYRACVLADSDRRDEAMLTFAAILANHPRCRWTPECAMWLAEAALTRGDHAAARQLWQDVIVKYSDSPRVAQARRWSAWLDEFDACWDLVQQAGCTLMARCDDLSAGVSMRLSITGERGQELLGVRAAFRHSQLYSLCLTVEGRQVLFASNQQGTWYCDGSVMYHTRDCYRLPLPQFQETERSVNFSWSFGSAVAFGQDETLRLPTNWLTNTWVEALPAAQGQLHIMRLPGPAGKVRLRCEAFSWISHADEFLDLELGPDFLPANARSCCTLDTGMSETVLSLQMGEHVDDNAFAVAVPPGMPVHEVEAINFIDVFGQIIKVAGSISDSIYTKTLSVTTIPR